MRLTAFLRGKRDGGGVPNIVRVLNDLARFSRPLGKAVKMRDFGRFFYVKKLVDRIAKLNYAKSIIYVNFAEFHGRFLTSYR